MKKQNASKSKTKIFVPKGTVSSDQDTVIEIPHNLQGKPMIIAKKQDNSKTIRPDETRRSYSYRPYQSGVSQIVPEINIDRSLAETEQMERETVLTQLEQYHQSRRKYLLEASALASSRPNLSLPVQTLAPPPNTTSVCPGSAAMPQFSSTMQSSYHPPASISLAVPPLPRVQPASRAVETDEERGCCEFALPFTSSTLRYPNKKAKSFGTSTSDLREDISPISIPPPNKQMVEQANQCNQNCDIANYKNNQQQTEHAEEVEIAEHANEDISDKDVQTEKLKPLKGNTSSQNSLRSLEELNKSMLENDFIKSLSAPTSLESCGPCCKSAIKSMPDIKQRLTAEILSKDELDKIQKLFDKARNNLRAVYGLASNLACAPCPVATGVKAGPANNRWQSTGCNSVKPPDKYQGDIEKRFKESQERFRKETDELKKLLQQMRINSCNVKTIVACPGTENNLSSSSIDSAKKQCVTKTNSIQRSILKQTSTTGKAVTNETDGVKKCVSVCTRKSLPGTKQGNAENSNLDSGKVATVVAAIYLNNDANTKNSAVTSTYYNKDFLTKSQSEKEIDTATRDAGVCTEGNCPLYRNK